jgi:hypothetical protein
MNLSEFAKTKYVLRIPVAFYLERLDVREVVERTLRVSPGTNKLDARLAHTIGSDAGHV